MCTVSFFKTKDKIIFTSNRDEKRGREKAVFPSTLQVEDQTLYFPKDKKALGTWFVADGFGNVAILLNGAFQRHKTSHPYKKSRGIVLLDLAKGKNLLQTFQKYDLSEIEPFQLLVYWERKLFRLLWDGNSKYEIFLNEDKHHLLSSKTLYDDIVECERLKHLDEILNIKNMSSEEILQFHKEHQIEREPGVDENIKEQFVTVSITQLIMTEETIDFRYYDLKEDALQRKKIEKRSFV